MWDTLGQSIGKFDYYVKYTPQREPYSPAKLENVIKGITTLFDDHFVNTIDEKPSKKMGTCSQE